MASELDPLEPTSPPEFDPTNVFRLDARRATITALNALDDDPDQAAKAQELSDAIGVHPAIVNNDLEHYQREYKANLTSQLLNNNAYLRQFINNSPLAAQLTNDDIGGLDDYTVAARRAGFQHGHGTLGVAYHALKGFYQGMDPEKPLGDWFYKSPGGLELATSGVVGAAGAAIMTTVGLPIEVPMRLFSGAIEGARMGGREFLKQAGMDEQEAGRLTDAIVGSLEHHIISGQAHKPLIEPRAIEILQREMADKLEAHKLMEYIKAGKEPPVGISPVYDSLKILEAEHEMKMYDEAVDKAEATLLKERSPSQFQEFTQGFGDRYISINAQKVRELYGEKQPLPDDNLLGWVDGIAEELPLQEASGGYIRIPVAEWMAKSTPEVKEALHDFIQIRPGALSLDEAKLLSKASQELSPPVLEVGHGPTDAVRAQLHAEPMFDPERQMKLKLRRTEPPEEIGETFAGEHYFDIVDTQGNSVGDVNITERDAGKLLYVQWVGATPKLPGKEGVYAMANTLGPGVVRDLLAQVRREFPNAERIGGFRTTGARREALSQGEMEIPLHNATPQDLERFAFKLSVVSSDRNLIPASADFTPRKFVSYGNEFDNFATFKARDAVDMIRPDQFYGSIPKALYQFFGERLKEMAGDVTIKVVSYEKFKETNPGSGGYYDPLNHEIIFPVTTVMGMYDVPGGRFFSSESLMHEIAHAATHRAVVTDQILNAHFTALMKEADAYMTAHLPGQREALKYGFKNVSEFIAEAWSRQDFQQTLSHVPLSKELAERIGLKPEGNTIWDAVRKIIADILEKIVGRRPGPTILDGILEASKRFEEMHELYPELREPGATGILAPKAPTEGPVPTEKPVGERPVIKTPATFGLTAKQWPRYEKLIKKRWEELEKGSREQELRLEEKKQTKEWKDNEEAMRKTVEQDILNRPDVAANELFRTSTLFGQKVRPVRLDPRFLTPEQKAGLPTDYVRREGKNPDDLAGLFGYQSGKAMVDRLVMLNQMQKEANKFGKHFINYLTDVETERRMKEKYGDLKENILREYKDRVMSDTVLDIIHEDILRLAEANKGELPFKRDEVKTWITNEFNKLTREAVDSDAFFDQAGKAGREAEIHLLNGRYAEAFKAKQVQFMAGLKAQLAIKFENNEVKKFERLADTYEKRGSPGKLVANTSQEFTNFIHDILIRVGRGVQRTREDLATEIAASGYADLRDFVDTIYNKSYGMNDAPIAEFLLDNSWSKPIEKLTVDQYREVLMSLQSLSKLGKSELKVRTAQEEIAREDVLQQMRAAVKTFPLLKKGLIFGRDAGEKPSLPRTFLAASTNMETLLNRWDRNDPRGVFNKYVVYPLAGAANRKAALQREFAKIYRGIGELKDQNKLVDSPFNDPLTISDENPQGKPWNNFTLGNVMVMIHNAGNESNWNVLAKGYGQDPAALKQWLFANSTKEMWDRAQRMGDMFKDAFERSQEVYRKIYDVAPAPIPLAPIETPFGVYEGWYHPLIKDPIRETYIDADGKKISGQSTKQKGGSVYDNTDNSHARTANGYTRSRTGAIYPLDLNPDMIPIRLSQILHDIAFREVLIETEKIFKDDGLRNEITKRYGSEYTAGLIPYLKGIAGEEGIPSQDYARVRAFSETLRQNVISSYIGFNVYTALKHGPTALVLSAKEVGIKDFAGQFVRALTGLYSKSEEFGKMNKDFVDKWSEEVPRRLRHWQDTIHGEHAYIFGESTLREKIIEKGSWLVAQSDMLSVRPTWLAAYRSAIEEGDTHGAAIDIAERAVRRAHGSTAVTNLPTIVRGGGPLHGWLTSIYGFFGTVMQRRIELAHLINDTYKLGREKEIRQAAANIPEMMFRTFAHVIWPILVEEYVTGLTTDDRRGLGEHIISGTFHGLGASVIYLRDLMHAWTTGHDPGVGLLSSPLHDHTKLINDLKKGERALSPQYAGKTVGDLITVLGQWTGKAPKEIGNLAHFGIDMMNEQQRPESFGDWFTGLTRGTTKKHVVQPLIK